MGTTAKAYKTTDHRERSLSKDSKDERVIRAERLEMPHNLKLAISKGLRLGKATRGRKR
jgi:hypothetical protein